MRRFRRVRRATGARGCGRPGADCACTLARTAPFEGIGDTLPWRVLLDAYALAGLPREIVEPRYPLTLPRWAGVNSIGRKGLDMATGSVKWFNPVKGYGFIQPSDGSQDAFVHISAVERAGLTSLREGQKVEFDLVPGRNGKSSAENLVVLD